MLPVRRASRSSVGHSVLEAIQRAPGEDYYREQRRRFLGERDPEDRPDYVPPEQRESEPEHEAPDEGGLSV